MSLLGQTLRDAVEEERPSLLGALVHLGRQASTLLEEHLGPTVAEIGEPGPAKMMVASGRLKDFRACCASVRAPKNGSRTGAVRCPLNLECGGLDTALDCGYVALSKALSSQRTPKKPKRGRAATRQNAYCSALTLSDCVV